MRFPVSPPALRRLGACLVLALIGLSLPAFAQEALRSYILVARPGMPDPNFRETVLLVSHLEGRHTIGVILNRPTDESLSTLLPTERFRNFRDPVHIGGPVERTALVAVFLAEKAPGEAFAILPGLFLSIHPGTIDELLTRPPAGLRLFTGYSGWAPGQLAAEIARRDWLVLKPTTDIATRRDTRNLWRELIDRIRSTRAAAEEPCPLPCKG